MKRSITRSINSSYSYSFRSMGLLPLLRSSRPTYLTSFSSNLSLIRASAGLRRLTILIRRANHFLS
jgi:hypothetical protein